MSEKKNNLSFNLNELLSEVELVDDQLTSENINGTPIAKYPFSNEDMIHYSVDALFDSEKSNKEFIKEFSSQLLGRNPLDYMVDYPESRNTSTKSMNRVKVLNAYHKIDHTLCLNVNGVTSNNQQGNIYFNIDNTDHIDCKDMNEMLECLETILSYITKEVK